MSDVRLLREFRTYCMLKSREHGEKWDPSDLVPKFIPHFESGDRIRVQRRAGDYTYTRTGTVSVTTGWRPAFLLIHRASDIGSSDVLGLVDEVIAVKRGRFYVDVTHTQCPQCGRLQPDVTGHEMGCPSSPAFRG